jgi:hypothetical protein
VLDASLFLVDQGRISNPILAATATWPERTEPGATQRIVCGVRHAPKQAKAPKQITEVFQIPNQIKRPNWNCSLQRGLSSLSFHISSMTKMISKLQHGRLFITPGVPSSQSIPLCSHLTSSFTSSYILYTNPTRSAFLPLSLCFDQHT